MQLRTAIHSLLALQIYRTQARFVLEEHQQECDKLSDNGEAFREYDIDNSTDPYSALTPCKLLPDQFVTCETPKSRHNNETDAENVCRKWGEADGKLHYANVTCHALLCIECSGPRLFKRRVPCIKYTGHYFVSTLLYSIFLGWLAVDRFTLGYTAIAVGKLITLAGLGIWWLIDIILLITGNLTPEDDSSWEPFY